MNLLRVFLDSRSLDDITSDWLETHKHHIADLIDAVVATDLDPSYGPDARVLEALKALGVEK